MPRSSAWLVPGGRDALTRAVAERGLTDVQQRVAGLAQFVSARYS
jgi:hypothetical protein